MYYEKSIKSGHSLDHTKSKGFRHSKDMFQWDLDSKQLLMNNWLMNNSNSNTNTNKPYNLNSIFYH